MKELLVELKAADIGKINENVLIKDYTTYKVGGTCRAMVFPKTTKDLILLLKILKNKSIKYMILGNGSNVLFSDRPYDGIIIKLDELNEVTFTRNKVVAGAGASLVKVSMMAIRRGLSGLEFAAGIPGTIGGAVYMNAGAYKSDMGYVVKSIKVLTPDFRVITMVNRELNFHYRTSFLKQNKDYICLEAAIQLKPADKEEIKELVQERKTRRLESQPLEYPSAGSVFRNPDNLLPAGKLIDDLGYKGLIKGGAQVSEKHANFIINIKSAKASDIKELIEFIHDSVKERYEIDLKIEQEFINWE